MNSSAVSWGGVVDSPWGHGRPGMNNSILSTGTERLDPAGERYASLENVHKLVEDELTRDEQDRLEIENVGQGAGYEKDDWGIEFVGSAVVDRLPEVVASRLENMEDLCFFGLLPDLNLAWVSVDDALCIWSPNPQDGPRPPARTLHCKDYVTAVCLVRPDPKKSYDCDGMPLFFLAVALRESVQLFKLELSDTEIALHDTPIEIPVDSFVCRMVSTPNGRLFVGCSDGGVYELRYEDEDYSLSSFWRPRQFRKTSCSGWRLADFTRRVTTLWQPYEADPITDMCFDPSRHVLYAVTQHRPDQTARQGVASALLSARTNIHAYILGPRGDASPRHIGPARLDQLAAACSSVQAKDRDIVAIHPIMASESTQHHCVLVSSTGFRLYLELTESVGLRIRTVRPPPPPLAGELGSRIPSGGQGRQPEEQSARVQASFYKDGAFILGMPGLVVCVCQDRNKDSFRPGEMREVVSVLSVPPDVQGQPVHLWQICETRARNRNGTLLLPDQPAAASLAAGKDKMQSTNELWTQHVSHPRRFICLGGNGVLLVNRRQPWEKMEFACKHQLYSQNFSRTLQGTDVVHRCILRFPKEQACATALFWWVLAAGDRGSDPHVVAGGSNRGSRQSAGAMAANVLFEPQYSYAMDQSGTLVGQGAGGSQSGRDPRLRGILICLARLLRPVWAQRIFDFTDQGVRNQDWQRLVEQLELVARFLTEFEERLQGRHLLASAREIRDLVKQCKECCSFMAIIGQKSFGPVLRSLDLSESQTKELEFKGLVLRLVCRPRENEMLQQQVLNVIYKLIEDGSHTRPRPAHFSPSTINDQVTRAAAKRDTLIRDIELHCPSIFRPAERSKMRADKCLAEAKQAANHDPDRLQTCLAEAREHYGKVSKDLNTEDLIRMCGSFYELNQPLSALHVLLKRFSEQVEVAGTEADVLKDLLQRIAEREDQAVLSDALQLSLEHKGLYRQAIHKDLAEPAVYSVFRAVLDNANSGFLWPILRRLPILRKTSAPQQFLVEFLRGFMLPEKLVELYTETGHYSKAGEVCMQQANARAVQPANSTADFAPTLDDRIYWFRQAAKAAKLNGGSLNNHVQATLLDQYADIAHIQKHLLEQMERRRHNNAEARDLIGSLKMGLVSMQEIFEKACEFDCYEVAMEVCELASAAGEVQAEYMNLSDVVSKLWKLMLQQAWRGEEADASLLSLEAAENAWRRVESSVCDIGRRYARKAGFLPLQDLVVWLEDCAFKHFYSPNTEWVEACKAEGVHMFFWCGQGDGAGSTLDAPAWRVPRLLLLGFGVGHLKLIRVYYDLYDSTLLGGDARRRVHCFRTLVMLYTLYLREARDTEQEALMPFAAIENDFVRLEAKPGVYAQELSHARGLLRALRTRRQQGFL